MNAPFLTGNQSPGHPGLINDINTGITVTTPPPSVVAPSSIESSPQELPAEPEPMSPGSLAQGHQILQQQQQQSQFLLTYPCARCHKKDCMVPSWANDDVPYGLGLHHHAGGNMPSPPQLPWSQTQSWSYSMAGTSPPQAMTALPGVSTFTNLEVPQHEGMEDLGFDHDTFSLLSSEEPLTPPVFAMPGSPESVTLSPQPQAVEQAVTQAQAQVQVQTPERKKLPGVPNWSESPTHALEDSGHESDVSSSDDACTCRGRTQARRTKTRQRRQRGKRSLSTRQDTQDNSGPIVPATGPNTAAVPNLDASNTEQGRQAKDQFLLECRARGMTYKEIKESGNLTEAESTLRGRHRVLTKSKEERIRKPCWTDKDVSSPPKPLFPAPLTITSSNLRQQIELLRTIVQARSWRKNKGKKTHILWGKVASDMVDAGSSYPFGSMTCSNKWSELTDNNNTNNTNNSFLSEGDN